MTTRSAGLAGIALVLACSRPASTVVVVDPPRADPDGPTATPPSAGMLGGEQRWPAAIDCAGMLELPAVDPRVPIAHVIVAVAPGRVCTIERVADVDAIVLVLEGHAPTQPFGERASRPLKRWDALRVPGLGVELQPRTEGVTVLLAIATSSGELAQVIADGKVWSERPGPVELVALSHADELAWGAGGFRARIAFGAPSSPVLGLEVLRFGGDRVIAPHVHDSWEVLTILAGNGAMRIASTESAIEAGTQIAIPPRTEHEAKGGGEDVLVVQSYSPAGAEQRFVQLDAAEP